MVKFPRLNYWLQALGWLFMAQMLPGTVSAEDDLSILQYVPNIITVDYGLDNDHGRDFFLNTNLGIRLRERLILGLGKQKERVTPSNEDLENRTYLAGYHYLPTYQSKIGAEYENWGDSDKATVDSIRVILAFNAGKFAITVTPEYRSIVIKNNSGCDDEIDSSSAKIELSADVRDDFSLNLSYVSYDYSNNLTQLGSCVSGSEVLDVDSRIDSVADETQESLGGDYYDSTETYGINFSRARTALSHISTKSISAYASTDQFSDWTLMITGGTRENLDQSTTLFIVGSVTYYW